MDIQFRRKPVEVDDFHPLSFIIFSQIWLPGMEAAGEKIIAVHLFFYLHLVGDVVDPADKGFQIVVVERVSHE